MTAPQTRLNVLPQGLRRTAHPYRIPRSRSLATRCDGVFLPSGGSLERLEIFASRSRVFSNTAMDPLLIMMIEPEAANMPPTPWQTEICLGWQLPTRR